MSQPSNRPIADLVGLELQALHPGFRDEAPSPQRVVDPSADLYGLALSGGGIRSATFNLGLMQGLHRLGLLRAFHYVSTVSGGGYVGSFWSAWRQRPDNHDQVFPAGGTSRDCPEPAEIRHLREFSNFLAPRLGLLSWDTGRLVVAGLSSMLPSLLSALSLLLLAVLAWCGVAFWLFADPGKSPVVEKLTVSACVMAALTLVMLVGAETLWRRRKEKTSDRAYISAMVIALVATVGPWLWMAAVSKPFHDAYEGAQRLPVIRADQPVGDWTYLFLPGAAWAAAMIAFVVLRWMTSSMANTYEMRMARTAFDRVQSRLLLLALAWTTCAVLWCVGVWVYAKLAAGGPKGIALGSGLAGVSTLGTAVFAWLQKRLTTEPKRASGSKMMAMIKPLLPQLLAYAILAALSVSTVALLVWANVRWENSVTTPGGLPLAVAAGAVAFVGSVLWFFDPNEVGLHAFYRGRLARAYTGASVASGRRKTEEQETDDFPLHFLPAHAPCHLVCCAANDLAGGGDMANLNRGAESAVLSRVGFSVGSEWAPWQSGKVVPTLAGAVTASAAAFNSLMGSKSIEYGPAVTFLMAAFNLRLGLWWPHPTFSKEQSLAERTLVGLPFFKEMFGHARANGEDVHLSDGAHFENLAVYELVRRHCRVIVMSDCGMDPDVAFDDFGNLVRRVREDFGVDIRIDLSPLRPDPETGRAAQPMVAGDIHYPEGDTGILLLFKPTLVGSEPADVTQYARRNTAFPHETTGDQFYDEAQWESYRRLGEHAARSAFKRLTGDLRATPNDPDPRAPDGYAAQVFNRARREWLPVPHGFAGRVSHLADRMVELDELLRADDCELLLREVYKEVDALDRWAKQHRKLPLDAIVGEKTKIVPPRRTSPGTQAGKQAPAAEEKPPLPEGKHLSASLHLIRRALIIFEEAYERENLEESYRHPVYLGLMNYMARWAYAPLFRMWWPLLKTLYPQPFTRFMEHHFGLAEIGSAGEPSEHVGTRVTGGRAGFAMEAWERQGGRRPGAGETVISYSLRMQYRGYKPPYEVQAAQAIVRMAGDAMVWKAEDFFVPPGLWGVGIGEDFLRHLGEGDGPLPARQLLVQVRLEGADGRGSRAEVADTLQLYRSAGFDSVAEAQVPEEVRNATGPDAKSPAEQGATGPRFRWMRADVVRRTPKAETPDAPGAGKKAGV